MRRRTRWFVAVAAVVAVVAAGSPVQAEGGGAKNHPGGGLEVVADGLDNPRGITIGKGHVIVVAEAGRGGPTLVDTPLGDSPGPICVGETGAVTKIVDGVHYTLATAPSAASAVDGKCDGPGTGIAATGPHGIDVKRKGLTASLGLGGTPEIRDVLAGADPVAASLGSVGHQWRSHFASADLVGFEGAADPDGQGVDSNPYGVERIGRAALVVDAGGNSLLKVHKNGKIAVVAVFAPRCVPFNLGPNPIPAEVNPCGDQSLFPAEAVPTDVARTKDGDYLVSTLGGFPFVPGMSRVFKVDGNHAGTAVCSTFAPVPAAGCEVFADGLTALVGIDVDRKGRVYAVQFADNGILGADSGEPGSDVGSVRVIDGTTGTVIGAIEGLTLPGGVAVRGKWVYITNLSVLPGLGQVVRAHIYCNKPAKCGAYS